MRKTKYRKQTVQTKGFGQSAEQEQRLREQGAWYVLGYGKFLDWSDLEPDCLAFTQKFWDEANELFDLLAKGQYVEALTALRQGPWSARDVGALLPELDTWALALSKERQALGPVTERTLRLLANHGLETYHGALQQRHKESFEATEALQGALEGVGLEVWDTGAYYDEHGNQDGPRDLVVGVPTTETEFSFRVHHSPRKAETDDCLPEEVKAVVAKWEAGE